MDENNIKTHKTLENAIDRSPEHEANYYEVDIGA